jgi:hypothetical protein
VDQHLPRVRHGLTFQHSPVSRIEIRGAITQTQSTDRENSEGTCTATNIPIPPWWSMLTVWDGLDRELKGHGQPTLPDGE